MPTLSTDDGVKLHYEEAGSGTPIVFVHEFAGDHRSWEPQLRHFSRRYRCIAYNARGYPPSEVPQDVERYSQARWRDDIRCVLDSLGIQRAHIVGLSMGAFASLHFGITYGYRALSITVAGGGYGAHPAQHRKFQDDSRTNAPIFFRNANGTLTRAAAFDRLRGRLDFLFSYLPTPGTVIYFGYGNTSRADRPGGTEGLQPNRDVFFMKLSYLFRLQ